MLLENYDWGIDPPHIAIALLGWAWGWSLALPPRFHAFACAVPSPQTAAIADRRAPSG